MEAESSIIGALRNTRKRRKVSSVAPESSKPEEKTLKAAVTEPKKAKPTRKKIGKLINLPSMPLDILFEILGHLKPYDLLKLARTTKDFRRLLMNKSSISVWKASLGEVPGLPPCPPQMNEPAWTNLVFSPQCHYCLATTRIVEWRFRMRICKSCSKTALGNLGNRLFRVAYFSEDQPESIEDRFKSLPFMSLIANRPGKRGVAIYLLSDYDELEKQYKFVLRTDEERAAYISQRKALIEEIYKHARLCEAWMKTQVEDRDTELRQLREDRRVAIIKKLQDLGWGEEIEAIRYPDYFANHKLVDRPQRLTERIWSNMKNELVEYMQQMRVKRLKREFDALVLKRTGIAAQFLRAYRNAKVNEVEIIPEGPDFCTFEPVQEIYRQPVEVEVTVNSFTSVIPLLPDLLTTWRKKLDDSLTLLLKMGPPPRRLALEEMMDLDLDLCWVDEDGEVCSRSVAKPGPFEGMTDEQVMERLKLATTAFICKACSLQRSHFEDICYDPWYDSDDSVDDSNSKILFYPQVLSHACLTRTVIMDWDWDYFHATEDPVANLNGGMSKRCLWSDSKLSVDVHAGYIVEEIVKLAGLDPATATPHDMDELDLRFACLRCSKVANASGSQSDSDGPETITTLPNTSGSRSSSDEPETITTLPLMKWRKAVKHYKDSHAYLNKHLSNHFMKVDGAQLNDSVKAAEREYRTKWDALWQCMHCRDTPAEKKPGTLREVEEHVNNSHDTALPVLNKDYCKHPAHLDIESGGPLFLVNHDAGEFSLASRQPADSHIN